MGFYNRKPKAEGPREGGSRFYNRKPKAEGQPEPLATQHSEPMDAQLGQEDRARFFRSLDAINRLESREQDADAWAQEVVPGAAPGPVAPPVAEPAPGPVAGPVAEAPGTNPYRMSQEQAYAEADEIDAGTNVLYEDIESSPAPPGVTHENVTDTIFDQPQPENRVTKTIEGMLRDSGTAVGNYASVLGHEVADIVPSIGGAGAAGLLGGAGGLIGSATAVGETVDLVTPDILTPWGVPQDESRVLDRRGTTVSDAIQAGTYEQPLDLTDTMRRGRSYLLQRAEELRAEDPNFAEEVIEGLASVPFAILEIAGALSLGGPAGLAALESMKHGIDPETGEPQPALEWAKGAGFGLFLSKLFPWIPRAQSAKGLVARGAVAGPAMDLAATAAAPSGTPLPSFRDMTVSATVFSLLSALGARGHGRRMSAEREAKRQIVEVPTENLSQVSELASNMGNKKLASLVDAEIEARQRRDQIELRRKEMGGVLPELRDQKRQREPDAAADPADIYPAHVWAPARGKEPVVLKSERPGAGEVGEGEWAKRGWMPDPRPGKPPGHTLHKKAPNWGYPETPQDLGNAIFGEGWEALRPEFEHLLNPTAVELKKGSKEHHAEREAGAHIVEIEGQAKVWKITRETATLEDGSTISRGEWHERVSASWKIDRETGETVKPVPEGTRPKVVFMAGGGASGKTRMLNSLREESVSLRQQGKKPPVELPADRDAIQINPDELKTNPLNRKLPDEKHPSFKSEAEAATMSEYRELVRHEDLRAAGVVHEESSMLSKRLIHEAVTGRYNVIFDGTMSGNLASLTRMLRKFDDAGYEMSMIGVSIPFGKALERAYTRGTKSKRLVAPMFLVKAHKGYSGHFEPFMELRKGRDQNSGIFDWVWLYSNDVAFGEPGVRVAQRIPSGRLTVQPGQERLYHEILSKQAAEGQTIGEVERSVHSELERRLAGAEEAGRRRAEAQRVPRDQGTVEAAGGEATAEGGGVRASLRTDAEERARVVRATHPVPPASAAAGSARPADVIEQGANYIPHSRERPHGFLEEAVPATKRSTRKALKRRGKIMREWAKAMGVPVTWGKMGRAPGAEGFWSPRRAVHARHAYDLEVVAHEFGHDMHLGQNRNGLLVPEVFSKLLEDAGIRAELNEAGYWKGNIEEGWADFIRVLVTIPHEAQRIAPKTYDWFDAREKVSDPYPQHSLLARNKKLGKAFRNAQRDMMDWYSADPLSRGDLLMGAEATVNDVLDGHGAKIRQGFFDDLAGIEAAERTLNSGRLLPGSLSPYRLGRIAKARVNLVAGAVERGVPVWRTGKDGPYIRFEGGEPLKAVLKAADRAGIPVDDFFKYMTGVRAKRLAKEGRENLLPMDVIEAWIGLGKKHPEMSSLAERYQKWNHGLLDFAVGAGILSKAAAAKLKEDFYFPFYRERGEADIRGRDVKQPMPGQVKPLQRLKGGSQNLRDSWERMIMNADRWIEMSVLNEAMGRVADLSKLPGGERLVEPIKRGDSGWDSVEALTSDAKRAFIENYKENRRKELLQWTGLGGRKPGKEWRESGVEHQIERELGKIEDMWDVLGPSFAMIHRARAPQGNDVFVHMVDGKPTYYRSVSPLLTRALIALHGGAERGKPKPLYWRAAQAANRFWKGTITHWPLFVPRAMMRDVIASTAFRDHGFIPLVDTVRGFGHSVMKTKPYWDAMADGATLSGIYTADNVRAQVYGRLKRKYGWDKTSVIDTASKFLDFYNHVLSASESSTRVGAHMRATGNTIFGGVPNRELAHPREGGMLGREIATDFAQRGDTPGAFQFVLDTAGFFRPGMAGLDRAYRGMFSDRGERARVWTGLGAITGISAANALLNAGNPLYDSMTDEQLNAYSHIIFRDPFYERAPKFKDVGDEDLVKMVWDLPPISRQTGEAWNELKKRFAHYKFPKAWEVGTVMSIAERTMDALVKRDFKDLDSQVVWSVIQNFKLLPFPTTTQAPLEDLANLRAYGLRPITQEYLRSSQGVIPEERAGSNIGPIVRDMGKATGMEPNRIQHYITAIANQWAFFGLKWADKMYADEISEALPGEGFLSRNFTQAPHRSTRNVNKLFETYQEVNQILNTVRKRINRYDHEGARELIEKEKSKIDMMSSKKIDGEAYYGLEIAVKVIKEFNDTVGELKIAKLPVKRLHQIANAHFKAMGDPAVEKKLRSSGDWEKPGKLKAALIEELLGAQIRVANRAMRDYWKRHNADQESGSEPDPGLFRRQEEGKE